MDFAVEVYKFCKELKENGEYIIPNQLIRSATSIGANIREAQYAASKADFINKMHIALKEANETGYWIELLLKAEVISQESYNRLELQCREIRILLINTVKTAKGCE